MYHEAEPSPYEQASVSLAEIASISPVRRSDVTEKIGDAHHLTRAAHDTLQPHQTGVAKHDFFRRRRPSPYERNAAISWHFERDPIPYALETDWPVGAAGFEPLHLEIRSAELHPA
jgi:hypothetical protein